MKILKVEIFSPDGEKIREVKFNESGLSIIYGDVEMPESEKETNNSIGKTVMLRILNLFLGANNGGSDTIKGLKGYKVKADIKYENHFYDVNIEIGNSKEYTIDGENYNLKSYKKFFNIDRALYSKQIYLEKRKGLISQISQNASIDDYTAFLKLLYLNGIEKNVKDIKKQQDKIVFSNKYKDNYQDDFNELRKECFNYEMKKKEIDAEIEILNNKIDSLKISNDIEEIAKERTRIDLLLKSEIEKYQLNNIKIKNYEELLNSSDYEEITVEQVQQIYEDAKINIPDMVKKRIEEVEAFYNSLLLDKKKVFINEIDKINKKNEEIKKNIENDKKHLDELSLIISENNAFKEALKIYDLKTKEKNLLDIKISEINGKLSQIVNIQTIKDKIDLIYSDLKKSMSKEESRINEYAEFVYIMVGKIYGEEARNPYLSINIPERSNNQKYKSIPIKIDLSIVGDEGEGIGTVKKLLIDTLISNYNKEIEFLIEDSSCFEGIDRRQIENIILETQKLSEANKKQYIISLNKYLLQNYEKFEKDIVLALNEHNTLLNRSF